MTPVPRNAPGARPLTCHPLSFRTVPAATRTAALRVAVAAVLALALVLSAVSASLAPEGRPAPGGTVPVFGLGPGFTAGATDDVAVLVQAPGAEARAAAAVRRLNGHVTVALPIVSGFAARVPADALDRLADTPGVVAVTPDQRMEPATDSSYGDAQAVNSVFVRQTGADVLAGDGLTGAGVRVALVDTGVSEEVATTGDLAGRVVPVADPWIPPTGQETDTSVVPCVNLSGEPTCDDTFGHGTFMAGLIAGSGAASDGVFRGVAPGAEIVSIKVGGADGSADVSKVLAGIQWAVSFADHYDIRVLNLALGTDSTVPPQIDPLNLAVQRAWVAGLTVVVSAGNLGPGPRTAADGTQYGTITKPGDDPFVITVGAIDDRQTPESTDNQVPAFTSWGPTAHGLAKPDVVAPGGRVVSLRSPGSTIDGLPGLLDDTYRLGSGTSMAAAVTSGLAALLLEARDGSDGQPAWRPDDVKDALRASALPVADADPRAIGAGMLQGPAALEAAIDPQYRTAVVSAGTGSLDGSRGSKRVRSATCDPSGTLEKSQLLKSHWTAQCLLWQGGQYAESDWTPQSWYESQWVVGAEGHNWQSTTWADGHNWQGHNWQGSSWHDQTDEQLYGEPTDGSASYGAWG